MDSGLLIAFIALTAFAVLLQAGMLAGMYISMRKTSQRVESLAEEVKTKVLPTAELAHSMMSELRPKIATVVRADLPALAQLLPGEGRVRFRAVTVEEAQAALRSRP